MTGTDGGNIGVHDTGASGGPSLGLSIDLSCLHRPPTRPANLPLPPTINLAGDPFVQHVGPKQPLPANAKPIDFLGQIFDDILLTHIVAETNLYAQQKGKYLKGWYDLTVPELEAFLGVCILMRLPQMHYYWSQNSIFGDFPVITNAFPRIAS